MKSPDILPTDQTTGDATISDESPSDIDTEMSGMDEVVEVVDYQRHRTITTALLRRRFPTMNEWEVEDLVSETFCRSARASSDETGFSLYGTKNNCYSWLATVAINTCKDYVRRDSNRKHSETTYGLREAVSQPVYFQPDEYAVLSDTALKLRKCIDLLAPIQNEVVTLFYLQEMTLTEVAEITGVPTHTVKTRLHHARASLRKMLKNGNAI